MDFRVIASANIPEATLDRLTRDWSSIGPMKEPERFFMLSVEPPTTLQILASLLAWTTPLKLAATTFATAIAKHAADDAWKNKAAIGEALKGRSTELLYTASIALVNVGSSIPRPVQIAIGLDFPDPHFGSAFWLSSGESEEAAAKIAALVLKGESIHQVLRDHQGRGAGPLGPVHLELEGSGEVKVSWMGLDHKLYSYTL